MGFPKGSKHSLEVKLKMSLAKKGKALSLAHRRAISESLRGLNTGANNGKWRGGKTIDGNGYISVLAPGHPHASKIGRVREHRLAMEKKLGRTLRQGEFVHHVDLDKTNNDPNNLIVMGNEEHLIYHRNIHFLFEHLVGA